jgi:hypothetical protein
MDRRMPTGPDHLPLRGIQRPGGLPWIPWRWIRRRYSPGSWAELGALFGAYQRIHSILDIDSIRSDIPPRRETDPCRRCGECCAQLLPEPVPDFEVLSWAAAKNPAHLFHAPITEGPRAGRFHTGWYHNGVRLRMCPLLLRDPASGDKFCVVYHFGPGHRPPGCEGFRPNWPHCEVSQRPLVP